MFLGYTSVIYLVNMWVNKRKDKVYSRYDYIVFINISASARLINMALVY